MNEQTREILIILQEECAEEYNVLFSEIAFEGSEAFWEVTRMAAPQFDNKTGDLFA